MIYDMQAETYSILSSVTSLKKVHSDYPSEFNYPPEAIYRTNRTPFFVDNHKEELQSAWVITIEVYGTEDLWPIVQEITDDFSEKGFKCDSKDANIVDYKRMIIVATGIVDNVMKYVFQK